MHSWLQLMHDPDWALVTDFDGTLVDTRGANKAAYSAAFTRNGVEFDADLFEKHFGLNFADLCDQLVPTADPGTRRAIAHTKAELYGEHFHMVRLNVGLVDRLRSAAADGAPIGLATTARRRNVESLLDHFGLVDLFDVSVTAEDVLHGKPAPDCYQEVARRIGIDPARMTVFEDSDIGMTAATAAGCNVVKVVL